MWDYPRMVTLKADDRRRVQIPDAKPGDVFAYELSGKVVKLTPLVPDHADAPMVKLIKGADGLYRLPEDVKISREDIRAAIRADRDAR